MGMKNIPIFLILVGLVVAQENVQTRIPRSLLECYEEPNLQERDSQLPKTIGSLIDLIRKVENTPGFNMDMRGLTVALLHRFKLDGIVKDASLSTSSNLIPYSPQGFQFQKHRMVLSNLITGNAFNFPNNSLTSLERCSIHSMLSTSVETNVRADGDVACSGLSQYRAARIPRGLESDDDVEVLEDNLVNKMSNKGNMQINDDDDDINGFGRNDFDLLPPARDSSEKSKCPVETGTIQTPWGTVSAGVVLSGIAAGLQPLQVSLGEISASMKANIDVERTKLTIDNRYAVTVAGDLAEVSLLQGPKKEKINQQIDVGSQGNWNDTKTPKWYFLSKQADYEMTDAEIRGGMDGLILGMNVENFKRKQDKLKLSQLLDMYYSQRGVYSNVKYRACNRKNSFKEVASTEKLLSETLGCTYILDKPMTHSVTITDKGFVQYSTSAVSSLNTYMSDLIDLSCDVDNSSLSIEASTDLHLIVDFNWGFREIYPNLGLLLDNLEISPFNSNVTLINAKNGKVIINSTYHLSTFHEFYNFTVHENQPKGLEFAEVFETIKLLRSQTMESVRKTNSGGGTSAVALFVISGTTSDNFNSQYVNEQIRIFRETDPDLTFLFLTAGSRDRYKEFVKQPEKDVLPLTSANNVDSSAQVNTMVNRIREVPRRIINPRCDANWALTGTGTTTTTQYVAPGMVNYHKLSPNYFFGSGPGTMVTIQGFNFGALTVCHSRSNELPSQSGSNTNNGESTCEAVTGNRIEINLADLCTENKLIYQCPPIYISVAGAPVTESNPRCTEKGCRYPDGIKYAIGLQDAGCYSSAMRSALNIFALILSVFISLKYII